MLVLMKPPRSSFFARKGAIFDMMTAAVAGVVWPLVTEEVGIATGQVQEDHSIEDTTNTVTTTRSLCLSVQESAL